MYRALQFATLASCLLCSAASAGEPESIDDTTRNITGSKHETTSSSQADHNVSPELRVLRGWLKETPLKPESFKYSKFKKAERTLVKRGAAALPTLMAVLESNEASNAETFVVLSAVVKLETNGSYVGKLLDLLEAGKLVLNFRCDNFSASSDVLRYWNRHLYKEADFERLVRLAKTHKK